MGPPSRRRGHCLRRGGFSRPARRGRAGTRRLYVADHGRQLQIGRIEPWYHALGDTLAAEVTGADVEDLCRRWMQHGPTWRAGSRTLPDGRTVTWPARDRKRVRPLAGASVNRLVAVLRKAFTLGRKQLNLFVPLSFPHFEEHGRGEYITEDQCLAICANYQAKVGREVKAQVFRLAYLKGVRKGQLRNTSKKNIVIKGDLWKLVWEPMQTKTKKRVHSVVLTGEARAIVEWAWANRLPECDFLFHVDGQPFGPMRSELKRTCKLLGIPYGRATGIVFHDTRHSARSRTWWRPRASAKRPPCRSPAMPIPRCSRATTCRDAVQARPTNASPPTSRRSAGRRRRCR